MAEEGTPLPNRDMILAAESSKAKSNSFSIPTSVNLTDRIKLTTKNITLKTSGSSEIAINYPTNKQVKVSVVFKKRY